MAQPEVALSLQGQVTTFSQVEGLPPQGTLWIQLRDPETSSIVHREGRSLSLASMPSRFDLPVSLPANLESRLLVGGTEPVDRNQSLTGFSYPGLHVTLNLDALLEYVANQGEHSADTVFEDLAPAPSASSADSTNSSAPASQNLSSLSPRSIPFQRIYLPSAGLTLPPVIYRPIDSKTLGAPSLPLLANQATRRRKETAAPPRLAKPLSLPPIGNTLTSPNRQPAEEQPDPNLAALDLPPLARSQSTDRSATTASTDVPATSPLDDANRGSETREFQPDFQGRFWSRLSALAHEAQKTAADLKAQMEAAGVLSPSDTPAPLLHPPISTDVEGSVPAAAPVNHEVVVYEAEAEVTLAPPAIETDLAESSLIAQLATEGLEEEDLPGEIPSSSSQLARRGTRCGSPFTYYGSLTTLSPTIDREGMGNRFAKP